MIGQRGSSKPGQKSSLALKASGGSSVWKLSVSCLVQTAIVLFVLLLVAIFVVFHYRYVDAIQVPSLKFYSKFIGLKIEREEAITTSTDYGSVINTAADTPPPTAPPILNPKFPPSTTPTIAPTLVPTSNQKSPQQLSTSIQESNITSGDLLIPHYSNLAYDNNITAVPISFNHTNTNTNNNFVHININITKGIPKHIFNITNNNTIPVMSPLMHNNSNIMLDKNSTYTNYNNTTEAAVIQTNTTLYSPHILVPFNTTSNTTMHQNSTAPTLSKHHTVKYNPQISHYRNVSVQHSSYHNINHTNTNTNNNFVHINITEGIPKHIFNITNNNTIPVMSPLMHNNTNTMLDKNSTYTNYNNTTEAAVIQTNTTLYSPQILVPFNTTLNTTMHQNSTAPTLSKHHTVKYNPQISDYRNVSVKHSSYHSYNHVENHTSFEDFLASSPGTVYSSHGALSSTPITASFLQHYLTYNSQRLRAFSNAKTNASELKALTFSDSQERFHGHTIPLMFRTAATVNCDTSQTTTKESSEKLYYGNYAVLYHPHKHACQAEREKESYSMYAFFDDYARKCLQDAMDNFHFDICYIMMKYYIFDPYMQKYYRQYQHDKHNHVKSNSSVHNQKQKRYFLEVGGLDGSPGNSMTKIFESHLGDLWDGLVVEATPVNYVDLMINRPCTYRTEVALGERWSLSQFLGWGGCCSGISTEMSSAFKQLFHGVNSTTEAAAAEAHRTSYDVLTAPLADVLNVSPFPRIDLWSLDVEGAEYFVLRGMNFSSFPVVMILLETMQATTSSTQARNGEVSKVQQAERDRYYAIQSILIANGFSRDARFQSWNNINELWINTANADPWMVELFHQQQHQEVNFAAQHGGSAGAKQSGVSKKNRHPEANARYHEADAWVEELDHWYEKNKPMVRRKQRSKSILSATTEAAGSGNRGIGKSRLRGH